MGGRCRLCAQHYNTLVNVLGTSELLTHIFKFFGVSIVPEDRISTSVCEQCCGTVTSTWEFNQTVQKAQAILRIEQEKISKQIQSHNIEPQTSLDTCVTRTNAEQTKRKVKSEMVKCKKFDDSECESLLSGASDAEWHEDGSITLVQCLEGWEQYPWTCCDCEQNMLNAEELRDHFSLIHGQMPKYMCADCPKNYTKYSTFISHVHSHRKHLRFTCDICGKWYGTITAQECHRSSHCDQRPFICVTCGKKFRVQSSLIVHARSHLPTELKNKHECDQCPKRFGTKPNLMAHKRIHTGIRDFTCDQCGKSFVQKGNLDNHMLTHTIARPFNCINCNKSFKTAVRLRKHTSVHSGLKPHHCDVCGRQFRERGTLKEHHRIHSGIMPFTCEYCGKSFRFKGVLTTHRRQHTGERPYSCLECQHHFTNWPNYNKHMKRRHGINTSVTVRKPQTIPPTGMPQRNPPGTVLAPPQPPTVTMLSTVQTNPIGINDNYTESPHTFYPIIGLFNFPEELLQQRV